MKKRYIIRCAYCKEIILQKEAPYKCDECGKEFCTYECKDKHDCNGLPDLFMPWEHDNEFFEEDGDELIDKLINTGRKEHGNTKRCIVCKQEKELMNDFYPYCLCEDCFINLRKEFLGVVKYRREKSSLLFKGFRVVRIPDENSIRKRTFIALLLAKKLIAERKIVLVEYQTPRKKERKIFELHDLRLWEVSEITIMKNAGKTYEFIPGCYLIVKDE
ncbi:MAG: hypothetical protein ACTSQ8_21715 [Candidatus Helarchaeota archaeon]